MALDRYGQKFNENMRGWLTRRRDENDVDPDKADAINALIDEAEQSMDAGYQPWDNEWEIMRNSPSEPKNEEVPDVPPTP